MSDPVPLSNFEILYTPQFPMGAPFTPVDNVDELVVKGYFLTISNINSKAYTFTVGFHCNVNPTPVPAARLLGPTTAVAFLDDGSPGAPLTIHAGANPTDFFVEFPVSAKGTVLVGILPAFFNASGLVSPQDLECRGWTDITLPPLPRRAGGTEAQASADVPIIVTAEQRLTFFPSAGDVPSVVEAQSAFTLPLASGAALIKVPPQPGVIKFEGSR